jgi:uncharacterized membrane protein
MNREPVSVAVEPIAKAGVERRIGKLLWAFVIIAYLAAMVACTASQHLLASAALLIALLAAALLRALIGRNLAAAGFLAVNLALVCAAFVASGPERAIGLMLVIAEATVAALFLRSLRAPGPDLITAIACTIEPRRSPRELAYTRFVCWAWAALMAAMAAISLIFIFMATPRQWWWWKLIGVWAVPVGFFTLEWLARHWILRRDAQPGFRNTIKALPRIDYARLFEP